MNKEEIKEYLKRVEELELKLTGKDKDTLQWLIYGYNECARLLCQEEEENNSLRTRIKTIKRNRKAQTSKNRKLREEITIKNKSLEIKNKRINRAIEYIENTRVDNNYMVQEKYEYIIEILKGSENND